MRYIVAKDAKNELVVAVWAKSQYRDNKGRECSHRDYIRSSMIPFENVIAVGDVHCNLITKEKIFEDLPWDGLENFGEVERKALDKKTDEFLQQNAGKLNEEIQSDWKSYQVYKERQRQFLASQGR